MNLNQVFLTLVCSSFMYVTFTVTSCSWLNLCGLISVKILMQPPLINLRYKKKLKSDSSSIIMFQTSTNFISFLSFRSSLYNKNNLVQSKSTDANVVDMFVFFFSFFCQAVQGRKMAPLCVAGCLLLLQWVLFLLFSTFGTTQIESLLVYDCLSLLDLRHNVRDLGAFKQSEHKTVPPLLVGVPTHLCWASAPPLRQKHPRLGLAGEA